MNSVRIHHAVAVTAVLAVALLIAGPAAAQEAPLDFTVSGSAMPGQALTVTVSTTDGSTIQSVAWSQAGGATAGLSGTSSATLNVTLPAATCFAEHLFEVLREPATTTTEPFHGGLPERFQVVGVNPLALEEAAVVALDAHVTTSSGSYTAEYELHVTLPWRISSGLRMVPVDAPVLLTGKEQASYDWTMTTPDGSSATLQGAGTAAPWFTPDVVGKYTVTVTDLDAAEVKTIEIFGGVWRGIINGQDEDGRPTVDITCALCHSQTVADWAQTGHAEIFNDNLETSTHYSESCLGCHTVGFDKDGANNGMDDQDDYQAFLDAGLLNNPGDNWTTMLDQFPHAAQHGNIQCENCHGPQNQSTVPNDWSEAHMTNAPRVSLSADVCGACHGEPARHARFQQWQISGHANYELAQDEGMSGSCAKCHTANGFLAWVENGAAPGASVDVTWSASDIHPQTCVTCHDPHNAGTTSGGPDTDAPMRIQGDTPELGSGFVATSLGKGAICATCHNSRRGLRNDATFASITDRDRAPHLGPQTDVLMGQNAFMVDVGRRSYHSLIQDSCVTCHMDATPPPADLSYNLGGTNHTFAASPEICSQCHVAITAESVQGQVESKLTRLHEALVAGWTAELQSMLSSGATIDFDGEVTLSSAAQVLSVEFGETHGRQALTVTTPSGTYGPVRMSSIDVTTGSGTAGLSDQANPLLIKAGWNYLLIEGDGSEGVHNPTWTAEVLATSLGALETFVEDGTGSGGGTGGNAEETGGLGPVSCSQAYVYWVDIAAHQEGESGSVWRTDLAIRNIGSESASIDFFLHASGGDTGASSQIPAGAQGIYEDIVSAMGVQGKGSLEICSDQPLRLIGRTFNQSVSGTFGQFADGVSAGALSTGQTASLLGLRQQTNIFRTNINLTNASASVAAQVLVTLYASDGTELGDYTVTVPPGQSVQDLQPFANRVGAPNQGWGFATVGVLSGQGVLASASVVDDKTNDATTVPMKR